MHDVETFDEAAALVVAYLSTAFPVGAWSVNRKSGHRHTVLVASGVSQGSTRPWASTPCSVMVAGGAPRSVSDARREPAYRSLTSVTELGIRAYTGVPLTDADGTLFGSLCGFDRRVMPSNVLEDAERLLDVFRSLLEALLRSDRERMAAHRREESAVAKAGTDALTGLRNRRGWDEAVVFEADRLVRYGDPAAVVVIDLDDLAHINDERGHAAGDAHLRRAAALLAGSVRSPDVLARLGGDEFAWLLLGLSEAEVGRRVGLLWDALGEGGIEASIGWAAVGPEGLDVAVAVADERMYAAKRRRRTIAADRH